MTTRVLATCNGVELVEAEPGQLALIHRGGSLGVVFFVVGLLVLIALVNAVVQVALGHWVPGLVLLVVGVAGVAALVALSRWRERRRQAPWTAMPRRLTFDLGEGQLRGADGRPLAPLASVVSRRAFQATSSSPSLRLDWPGGGLVVGHGTPFGDGVDDLEQALQQAAGIRAAG